MRAFFAIDLPLDYRNTIADLVKILRKVPQLKHAKWVKPENLHITLKFLGNINEEQYHCIVAKTKTALENQHAFNINLSALQFFPSLKKPHVLILKTEPLNILTPLAIILDKIATECGVPAETRPFAPHLTLARLEGRKFLELDNYQIPTINFAANSVKLMQSILDTKGSVYITLQEFKFQL